MYDPVALDHSYANQPLPRHYESEEEDISESEYTSHSRSATLDSITSTTPSDSDQNVDRPALPRLLSPFPAEKSSRPASMDTVKRSSSATFVTEPCTIFDNDDDSMILELPSPDSTTPLQSPIFLQPAVYVPSEPLTSPRTSFHSLSSSSASIYSDDDSDVCVAEQVTYVEHAKPNLILISPTATEQSSPSPRDLASPTSSSDGSVYSTDEASHSQPVLGETPMDRGRSRYYHNKSQGSLSALDTLHKCDSRQPSAEPMSAPAVEARRLSFSARSMSFSRPQTPASTDRRRLQKEPPRRPPSAASTATFSLFPTQSQTQLPHGQGASNADDDARARSASLSYSYSLHSAASSTYSLSSSQPPSHTASPNPYYNPAYNRSRSGSLYSISSTTTAPTGKRPPMSYRGSLVKSSTFNVSGNGYSSSSLRAELGSANGSVSEDPPLFHDARTSQTQNVIDDSSKLDSKTRRKKSMKQLKPSHGHSESKSKAFVGFMLGQRNKRKSVIKS
ncbi:hypothetical protein BDW69DRAFT_184632 [Aspergillus filifer]